VRVEESFIYGLLEMRVYFFANSSQPLLGENDVFYIILSGVCGSSDRALHLKFISRVRDTRCVINDFYSPHIAVTNW